MVSNLNDVVGHSVIFPVDMPVYEQQWDSPSGMLPAYTPTSWKIASATQNDNGFFVLGHDNASGHSAVIRFDRLQDISVLKETTWSDFMNTEYGRLLFVNLLSGPGTVPQDVIEAAKGQATPIVQMIQQGGGVVEAVADTALNVLSAGKWLAENFITVLIAAGAGYALWKSSKK